jgi:LemA protein
MRQHSIAGARTGAGRAHPISVARPGATSDRATHAITVALQVGCLLVAGLLLGGCGRTELTQSDLTVREAWRNVEFCYAHRVAVAAAALRVASATADFDRPTLDFATEATNRAAHQPPNAAWSDDPQSFDRFKQAHGELTLALFRLLAEAQRHPGIAARSEILAARDELTSGLAQLEAARSRYSAAIAHYNRLIGRFPIRLWAGLLGFREREDFARLRDR